MSNDARRARARRRAWGRGPMILRFEPLEDRELLAAAAALPDIAPVAFDTVHNLAWGDTFHAKGIVANQGAAAASSGFHVNIYASPTAALGVNSTLIGQATIPAGLLPGQSVPFDEVVSLPRDGMAGVPEGGAVYVSVLADPDGYVTESNKLNNAANGQGYDTSVVTITPRLPSYLSGSSLGVYPDQAAWGQAIQVNAQVSNTGTGDAPATRARLVLTPSGTAPGSLADYTIGSIAVPAVPANQTVAVSQTVTLPALPPATLASVNQYTLSIVQDADFATNSFSPHLPSRGFGYDMTQMVITMPTGTTLPPSIPRPDLAVTALQAPSLPLVFGQSFQVSTTIENQGNLESGAFRVRFLLAGSNGSLDNALYLGDATLESIKPGFAQNVVQTIQLPSRLPDGVSLDASASGRIAIIIDPERTIDEANLTNNVAYTTVVSLQLVNTDGTTTPVSLPASSTVATTTTSTAAATRATVAAKAAAAAAAAKAAGATPAATARAARVAAVAARAAATGNKYTPKPSKHTFSHNLKVFPENAVKFLKKLLPGN